MPFRRVEESSDEETSKGLVGKGVRDGICVEVSSIIESGVKDMVSSTVTVWTDLDLAVKGVIE